MKRSTAQTLFGTLTSKSKKFPTIILILLGFNNMVHAHPHMFVDVMPKIIKKSQDQVNIEVKWFFDPATSDGYLIDYDSNMNGKLDKKELNLVAKQLQKNLKRFNYFTTLLINGKKQTIKPLKLSMSIADYKTKDGTEKRMLCKFELHTKLPQKPVNILNFDLSFYDDTNYSVLYPNGDFEFPKKIKVTKNKLKKSKCQYLFSMES